VIRGLGLAAIKLSNEFEVSMSIGYEDMKGGAKCRKWGGLVCSGDS